MIFQTLTRVRQKILLNLIFAMATGLLILILPNNSYGSFSVFVGIVLLIYTVYATFKFLDSSKAVIHYLRLLIALFLGIIGFAFIVYDGFLINVAALCPAFSLYFRDSLSAILLFM
ncbi:MAG: hypothetical protein Q4B03_00060 [Lachnospiraceae bacterium]|nr:hypothetical protein [Lachnospiraceae bacterium]